MGKAAKQNARRSTVKKCGGGTYRNPIPPRANKLIERQGRKIRELRAAIESAVAALSGLDCTTSDELVVATIFAVVSNLEVAAL